MHEENTEGRWHCRAAVAARPELKVGANLGRYSLSMPSNFSFGVAESHLEQRKWYRCSGVDPNTQLPLGLAQIGSTYTAPGHDGTLVLRYQYR
ncbi:hypothetical protein Jab_2c15320 [Janthinobacterium sp. HH01]|uniref:hypothetical protein n=1 Tax=Janthinobacterium sp. HH01 TaxID=1198452 RepID=UPI0002AE9C91|nr:hypothetical protein [Janthinobacterium sp. HH01]ELX09466.1 hypothetical protein Jab_2c15320 [Janthinobacterium sp. HH01]